ncbi:MAG: UPF0149 family protein [Alphaproteobacteria bacterium]
MKIVSIRAALGALAAPSSLTFRAAVADAATLAPEVMALATNAGEGVCLLPHEHLLFFRGIHVLAEARERRLYAPLLSVMRLPEPVVAYLLGDAVVLTLKQILLAVFDGDADPLFAIVERRTAGDDVVGAVIETLARLTFDGAVPTSRMQRLLEMLDQDELIEDDSFIWFHWRDAVALLGLVELTDAARETLEWIANDPDEVAAWEADLKAAAETPEDPARFAAHGLVPLEDAAATLSLFGNADDEATAPPIADRPDPAAGIALDNEEVAWLEAFLASRHVPRTAASVEELDGLLAAVAAGPEPVPLIEWMPVLLGEPDRAAPDYHSDAQKALFESLIERHVRTIETRLSTGYPHVPLLADVHEDDVAAEWCVAFLAGVDLREDAWAPLFENRRRSQLVEAILALADDADEEEEPPTGELRTELVETLPLTPLAIWRYWRRGALAAAPARRKVGRNEPCPCGSGRKFKFCCGSPAGPAAAG